MNNIEITDAAISPPIEPDPCPDGVLSPDAADAICSTIVKKAGRPVSIFPERYIDNRTGFTMPGYEIEYV